MLILRTYARHPIAVGLAIVLAMLPIAPAFASPLSDKRAEAAAIQAQVDTLDTKVSMADEAYNTARDRREAVAAEVRAAERRIARLKAQSDAAQATLALRADQMYRDGGQTGMLAALLSADTFAEFESVLQALTDIAGRDASTLLVLTRTQAALRVTRQKLVTAESEAALQEAAVASNLKVVRGQLAARSRMLAAASADVRKILADAQARRDAEARARYQAYLSRQRTAASSSSQGSSSGSTSGSGGGSGNEPVGSSRGAAAVRRAEQALGRPYQWGASGPSRFDCSGLTMWAYGSVGVSLPHSSRAQIGRGTRVARANLRPGDLVFFGNPIHHVGMYVGGGDFIESPHTGAVVRFASLSGRGDYAGASRP